MSCGKCNENPSIANKTSQIQYDGGQFSCDGDISLLTKNCDNLNEVLLRLLEAACQPNAIYQQLDSQNIVPGDPEVQVLNSSYTVPNGGDGIYKQIFTADVILTDGGSIDVKAYLNGLEYNADTNRQIKMPAGTDTTSNMAMYISEIQLSEGDVWELRTQSVGAGTTALSHLVNHLQKIKNL